MLSLFQLHWAIAAQTNETQPKTILTIAIAEELSNRTRSR